MRGLGIHFREIKNCPCYQELCVIITFTPAMYGMVILQPARTSPLIPSIILPPAQLAGSVHKKSRQKSTITPCLM